MATKVMSSYDILALKEAIRERDGQRCVDCGMTADESRSFYGITLDVHRIVSGSAYTMEGCVTVCKKCHGKRPHDPVPSKIIGDYCVYTPTKISSDVMPRVKAAAALTGKSVQEYLSDLANEHASEVIHEEPVKRLAPPPHPKRPKK